MVSHKAFGQEQAMNGLSDVRLKLASEELQGAARSGRLNGEGRAAATLG